MGYIRPIKTPAEVKRLGIARIKEEYNVLAQDYVKVFDRKLTYCHKCDDFLSNANFYTSSEYASGFFPICKKCVLEMVEQRKSSSDKPNETKESVQMVLQMMNLPYIDSLYENCCRNVENETSERKTGKSPFVPYLTMIKSLSQYKGKTWKNSEFPVEYDANLNKKIKASTIKRFGEGLNVSDYIFLQDEYDDWITRCECNTKPQEELFERLSFKKWEIYKATREGKNTKDLDDSYQKLMNTANIAPKQNSLDTAPNNQTLGTLIDKYENTRPLPEIDEELKDVDKIGLYINIFFKGHLAKMMGLKKGLSSLYDKFMKQYTVEKPEYDNDENSGALFDAVFGGDLSDE